MSDNEIKEFEVDDFEQGTFYLWDNIFETKRKWQLTDRAKTGLAMLMQSSESELPKNEKELEEKMKSMSNEEVDSFLRKMNRASQKQIAVLSSLVTTPEERPDIYENKMEFLASCITDKSAVKIYAFFLIKSTSGTIFQGEIRSEMMKILNGE